VRTAEVLRHDTLLISNITHAAATSWVSTRALGWVSNTAGRTFLKQKKSLFQFFFWKKLNMYAWQGNSACSPEAMQGKKLKCKIRK